MVIQGQEDPVESSGFNDCSCFYIFSEELAKRIQEAEELAAQRQQQQADQPPAGGSRDRHRGPRGQGQGRRSPQRSEKSKNVSNLHHWPFLLAGVVVVTQVVWFSKPDASRNVSLEIIGL